MDNIHIFHNDEQFGPFTEEKIRRYLDEGRIEPSTLAWVEGAADWKPISEMLGLPAAPAVQTPPPPQPRPQPQQQAPAYVAPQAAPTNPQSDPKKLILASWIMIGVTCLVSLIPGVGFLTWVIAFPILLVTFILGILTLNKGRTTQGISILLVSLVAAPIFIFLAPIITTAGAVAASEGGVSSESSFDDFVAEVEEATQSTEPTLNQPPSQSGIGEARPQPRNEQSAVAGIGDKVKLNDSEWEVISARELGNVLSGGEFIDAKRSEGKFIYVRYKVTNNTSEEQAVLFTPSLKDSRGRKFEEIDDLEFYLGNNETGMTMEQLPSGLPKSFTAIFDVPADASGFQFMARNFEAFGTTEKPISIGF